MKLIFTALACIMVFNSIAQSDPLPDEKKNAFVLFTGPSMHQAYKGVDWDREVSLGRCFSAGLELGFRYERKIAPSLYGSLGLGADFVTTRNQIIATPEYLSSQVFESSRSFYYFLEGGIYYRARKTFRFFGGYRLNHIRRESFEYREIHSDYEFGMESIVNPEKNLITAIVFRPEIEIRSRKSQRTFIIGLQAVGSRGSSIDKPGIVEGTYFYKSNVLEEIGIISANIAQLTILGQIRL